MHRVHEWVGRKDRQPVEIEAMLYRLDGSRASVKLTNFTEEGCRIESDSDLQIGERLAIALPRMGHIKAQVRWALPGSAGAKFLTETDF